MAGAGRKRCTVAYATRERQWLWEVELDAAADIAAALAAARERAARDPGADLAIPWDDAPVGVYGQARTRASIPRDGERIELYRALRIDPKESRRARASPPRAQRRTARERAQDSEEPPTSVRQQTPEGQPTSVRQQEPPSGGGTAGPKGPASA